ncbi:MAG: GNAT family N-acetyltransferase [Solirubrobacteraceae bacterium]
MAQAASVLLLPWGPDDLPLLEQLMGDPEMMRHLGGANSPQQIAERQGRYEKSKDVFKVVAGGEGVGWVGFWERNWRDQDVYETGWSVIPAFQGRGIAAAAGAQVIAIARAAGTRRFMHAFPVPENGPSNAVCRKLGFTLIGECELEFPPGHVGISNDWQLDLTTPAPPSA